ncbi:Minor extracellular protease vpr [Metarhizium anisopliae]
MTTVDKLHKEGDTGKGVTIAVVDTGVDYTHPTIGGCFGQGCRVAKGANLIPNARNRSDPMDTLGHGTQVAGIIAGYDAKNGFIGVLPNATIHAYAAESDLTTSTEDTMIAAWLEAYKDGAQVIVSSIGLSSSWAERPSALVVSRITARGIPCIVALGNDHLGPFDAVSPGTGRGAVAVNSVSRSHGRITGEYVYRINSNADIAFGVRMGAPHAWDTEELAVHDIDADYGGNIDDMEGPLPDCQPRPGDDGKKDLTGRVALIRYPVRDEQHCIFEQRVLNATARGAIHVLAWSGRNALQLSAPKDAKGIVAIGMTDATVGEALVRALSAGMTVRVRQVGPHRITTGSIAKLSSYGPTYILDIKPSVLAPGDDVRSTLYGGGYGGVAGTSFAAPLVAGIYALVGEARGTFDPAILDSVIMGTAEPQSSSHSHYSEGAHDFLSVAQQGADLVKSWEAAHATTLVAPASLAFNDTTNRVSSITLSIKNTADTTVQYQLTHISAKTLYTLDQNYTTRGTEEIDAPAQISLSEDTITLSSGESDTIIISASDPQGVDLKRLPLWSGWIAINGSDNTRLAVPYLGLAGSLRGAPVFSPGVKSILARGRFHEGNVAEGSTVLLRGPVPPNTPVQHTASSRRSRPRVIVTHFVLALGSPEVQVYVVPLDICSDAEISATALELDLTRSCVPKTSIIQVGEFQTIGQIANSPFRYIGGRSMKELWDGSLSSGQFVPPGRYKLMARALSILGDRNIPSDWQAAETTEFVVAYEGTGSAGSA